MLSSQLVWLSFANTGTWVWEECWQGDELIKVELCHHLLQESEMSPWLRRVLVQAAEGRIRHWSSPALQAGASRRNRSPFHVSKLIRPRSSDSLRAYKT